jgi:hypothetical protein
MSDIPDKDNKPKAALIKLDGTIIKTDGSSVKSNFFKFLELNPNDYSDISFTPEEARKISTHLSHLSTGSSAAIPIICGGAKVCPFSFNCPFVEANKVPLGRPCLIEVNLLNEWTRLYAFEYNIDENSFTELQVIRELAEIELMLWRLNENISKPENAELIQDVVVGVDKQGNILTKKETTAFFDAKERLNNRKSRLVKLMVGDRQEKYKKEAALKTKSSQDPSSSAADLRSKLQRLLEQAETTTKQLREQSGIIEGTVVEKVDSVEEQTLSPDDLISNDD